MNDEGSSFVAPLTLLLCQHVPSLSTHGFFVDQWLPDSQRLQFLAWSQADAAEQDRDRAQHRDPHCANMSADCFKPKAQKGRKYARWMDLPLGVHFQYA